VRDVRERRTSSSATGKRRGLVVWLTGLPAAGKTTVAKGLLDDLDARGLVVELLDGDELRRRLSPELGFSPAERERHIARTAWLAGRLARTGAVVLVAVIAPYAEGRRHAREEIEQYAEFVEVHVATPLHVCVERDPKGLYRRAFAGELTDFTGVSAPYERPANPDLSVETTGRAPSESSADVLLYLERTGLVPR
jgi:adenylylsulfate kinase